MSVSFRMVLKEIDRRLNLVMGGGKWDKLQLQFCIDFPNKDVYVRGKVVSSDGDEYGLNMFTLCHAGGDIVSSEQFREEYVDDNISNYHIETVQMEQVLLALFKYYNTECARRNNTTFDIKTNNSDDWVVTYDPEISNNKAMFPFVANFKFNPYTNKHINLAFMDANLFYDLKNITSQSFPIHPLYAELTIFNTSKEEEEGGDESDTEDSNKWHKVPSIVLSDRLVQYLNKEYWFYKISNIDALHDKLDYNSFKMLNIFNDHCNKKGIGNFPIQLVTFRDNVVLATDLNDPEIRVFNFLINREEDFLKGVLDKWEFFLQQGYIVEDSPMTGAEMETSSGEVSYVATPVKQYFLDLNMYMKQGNKLFADEKFSNSELNAVLAKASLHSVDIASRRVPIGVEYISTQLNGVDTGETQIHFIIGSGNEDDKVKLKFIYSSENAFTEVHRVIKDIDNLCTIGILIVAEL